MPDLKPRPCPFCGADIKSTGKIMRADGKIVWKHGYVGCAIDGSTIVDVETWNRCPRNGRRMIMGDMMTFPATVEEFMEQYKMTDTEHVYSNGTEYVPLYRMKQWLEHCRNQWSGGAEDRPGMVEKKGEPVGLKGPVAWCPSCGAKDIKWDAEKDICVCMTCGRIIK